MKTVAAKWLRGLEIALVVGGVSLLLGVFAATDSRWQYQARQSLALADAQPAPVPESGCSDGVVAPQTEALDPLVMGRIEIPRVEVSAIVRQGVDDETLDLAVGHVTDTARPGEIGNTVLAGHRDTFFRGLRNISVDDRIVLVVPPHEYEYRVVSLEVVPPTEISVLDPTENEVLTLVTCHPFNFIGSAPNRFIVRAERVE